MTITPCPLPRCSGPDGNPTLTAEGICSYCRPRVARDLTNAPRMYVQLHLGLELTGSGALSDKVSGTKTASPPLRIGMLDAGSAYARVLSHWTSLVRVELGLSVPHTGRIRESWSVVRSADILTPRIDQACAISPQSACDLYATAIVARRLLGLTRLVHRLMVPCPDCDLLALYREDGAAYVRCSACGAAWSEELYQSLSRVIAAEYELLDKS